MQFNVNAHDIIVYRALLFPTVETINVNVNLFYLTLLKLYFNTVKVFKSRK